MGRFTINITFTDFHHEVMEIDGVKIDETGDLMLYDLVPVTLGEMHGKDITQMQITKMRMRADRIYHESEWIGFAIEAH